MKIYHLFALLLTIVRTAVEAKEFDVFDFSLRELLEIDITSSTLTPKRHKSVPSSVSAFCRDEILNLVPGFQVTRGADHGD